MLPRALLFICLAAAGTFAAECDDNVYLNCQYNLNKALNLSNPQPYNDPTAFRFQVESYYQNSASMGLRTVCKAFREFKTCMGANYPICISPANFVGIGVTPMNAYMFVSTFNTMHYTCGAGFQVFLSNQNCMTQAWKANSDSANMFYACRTKFEATSNTNPNSACQLANTYMDCWEQEMLGVCGTSARDTQFWACEYARINTFTRFPACPIKCVLPYSGGIIG